MIQKVGFIITMLGVMAADSECLLVPTAMVVIGLILMTRREERA